MNDYLHPPLMRRRLVAGSVLLILGFFALKPCAAQVGTLAEPFPAPSPNAALHYQRALLHLARIDGGQTGMLSKPIWQLTTGTDDGPVQQETQTLLRQARYAVHSAAMGSRIEFCNFGIDFEQSGAASQLPHVEPMVSLGRLLTLRGKLAEDQGQWEEALIIYFDGLRMGRHLTQQSTLLETLAGIEILRNNYHALSSWASRCPARLLVARAFGLLESMQSSLVNPSRTIAREASILSVEFDQLREAYPDGNWETLLLESAGKPVTGDAAKDREAAMAECVARGAPPAIFESKKAFNSYLYEIEATGNRFIESVAACMTLPPKSRLKRASALNKKYAMVIPILSAETLIDVVELGALMAQHEADLTVTRIALAVAASKQEGKFPSSLDQIGVRFGGNAPLDPYRQQPVKYETRENQKEFSIEIPSLGRLPRSLFDSSLPLPAN